MKATNRIDRILDHCRVRRYPDDVIAALHLYLGGSSTLNEMQRVWNAANSRYNVYLNFDVLVQAIDSDASTLDQVELRILDLSVALGSLRPVIRHFAPAGPIMLIRDYLLYTGMQQDEIIKSLLDNLYWSVSLQNQPTALGAVLLAYLPGHSDTIKTITAHPYWHQHARLVELLTVAQPSYIDLAWELTQLPNNESLGHCVGYLAKAAPERFTDLARQIAGPFSTTSVKDREAALGTLMTIAPAQNIDLAVAAYQGSHNGQPYEIANLRRTGLALAYAFDPDTFWPLVEQASLESNQHVSSYAVCLLTQASFDRARPALQRCVMEGEAYVAQMAITRLLECSWEGQPQYVLEQLAHRLKDIRDSVSSWIVGQGEAMLDRVAPYLAHKQADTRLSAVLVVQRIGGEGARALLTERLDLERVQKIKRAILDAIGAPEIVAVGSASAIDSIVAEAEATMKRVDKTAPTWLDLDRCASLRWHDGAHVPRVVLAYLLYRQSRTKGVKVEPQIMPALALIDRKTSGDLAFQLWQGWLDQHMPGRDSWLLMLIGVLGDDRLVPLLREQINELSKGPRRVLAIEMVQALGVLGSDAALAEIDDVVARFKHSRLKEVAQETFTDAARRLNLSRDDLLDRATPTLGFDANSEQTLDYGGRQLTVRVKADGTLTLFDPFGKSLANLPKPRADDDPHKAVVAEQTWKLLKTQVKQTIKQQVERLQRGLISQRRWSVERWQSLFGQHPLLCSLATSLVWMVAADDQFRPDTTVLFRPLEDGTLTDANDEEVTLPAAGTVRLVHPLTLDNAALTVWQQHLADYDVVPPFPQLARPVVRLAESNADQRWWEQHKACMVNGATLQGKYRKAGWERGERADGGWFYAIWKQISGTDIDAVLKITGSPVWDERGHSPALLGLAFVRRNPKSSSGYDDLGDNDPRIITLGDVPPVLFSEVAADVTAFAAGGTYDPDWERKVRYF